MSGDGDGWVHCALGHRHWGRFGAAGLLISDGQRTILQHRAPWTHEGDRWGLPGGARDSHEDATSTALREALEEAALPAAAIDPIATSLDDHGGWSYTTVLARPIGPLDPHAANAESTQIRWWPTHQIEQLPLHHGLAAKWLELRTPPRPLVIVVDSRSEPRFASWFTGGADRRDLDSFIRHGVPVAAVPGARDGGAVSALLPRIVVVGERDRAGTDRAEDRSMWWQRALTWIAVDDVRSRIAQLAGARSAVNAVVVVTDDAALRTELAPQASVVQADWLDPLLER